MKMNTIGFIGLGLIRGSIAKAIRAYHPEVRMMAYMRSQDTLQTAVAEGVIDVACTEVSEQFAACDLLFLCAPVETNARYLEQLKPCLLYTSCLNDLIYHGQYFFYRFRAVSVLRVHHCRRFLDGHMRQIHGGRISFFCR